MSTLECTAIKPLQCGPLQSGGLGLNDLLQHVSWRTLLYALVFLTRKWDNTMDERGIVTIKEIMCSDHHDGDTKEPLKTVFKLLNKSETREFIFWNGKSK